MDKSWRSYLKMFFLRGSIVGEIRLLSEHKILYEIQNSDNMWSFKADLNNTVRNAAVAKDEGQCRGRKAFRYGWKRKVHFTKCGLERGKKGYLG